MRTSHGGEARLGPTRGRKCTASRATPSLRSKKTFSGRRPPGAFDPDHGLPSLADEPRPQAGHFDNDDHRPHRHAVAGRCDSHDLDDAELLVVACPGEITPATDRRRVSTTIAQSIDFGRQTRLAAMLAAISAKTTPSARKTGILKKSISSIFTPMNIRTSARP